MNTRDVITVVVDPHFPLGKQFSLSNSMEVKKTAAVVVPFGKAVQHHVPDMAAMEKLLIQVSENSHAAIINSVYPSIPIGTEFFILSELKLKKIFDIDRFDPSVTWPAHVQYDGKDWPVLGRFNELTASSSWLLLDRDVDEHTPKKYADFDYEEWITEVDKLIPGVSTCSRLRAHSSSARVSVQGKPVGGGNGHTWIQVENPEDIKRLGTAVKARAMDLGMVWKKPKKSRSTGEIVAYDLVSILDWSVFNVGRLVFVGKPEVRNGI